VVAGAFAESLRDQGSQDDGELVDPLTRLLWRRRMSGRWSARPGIDATTEWQPAGPKDGRPPPRRGFPLGRGWAPAGRGGISAGAVTVAVNDQSAIIGRRITAGQRGAPGRTRTCDQVLSRWRGAPLRYWSCGSGPPGDASTVPGCPAVSGPLAAVKFGRQAGTTADRHATLGRTGPVIPTVRGPRRQLGLRGYPPPGSALRVQSPTRCWPTDAQRP
jgi:hypothetical protein